MRGEITLTCVQGFDIVTTKMFNRLSLGQEIRNYWTALTRLIYPDACIFCEEPLFLEERHACRSSMEKMSVLEEPLCSKC